MPAGFLFDCFPFAVCGSKLQWTEWNHIAWKLASKTARTGPDWKRQIGLGSQNPWAAEVSWLRVERMQKELVIFSFMFATALLVTPSQNISCNPSYPSLGCSSCLPVCFLLYDSSAICNWNAPSALCCLLQHVVKLALEQNLWTVVLLWAFLMSWRELYQLCLILSLFDP